MTTLSTAPRAADHVVRVLARHEARRLILHPVMLIGWALMILFFVVSGIVDTNPVIGFDMITVGLTFYPGLLCILAAHMVTTRDGRAGAGELVDSVPASRGQRALALLLASTAPALVGLGVNLLARQALVWRDQYVEVPGFAHVVQSPITVLGGCLLGVMLGLWVPQRLTPVLAMVALVAGSIMLDSGSDSTKLFSPMVSWVDWGPYDGTVWFGLSPGNPGAHVLYLLGLCGLAAAAAWLRVTEHRGTAVALGLASLACAVGAGIAQLP